MYQYPSIDTPALLIEQAILEQNLARMQGLVTAHQIALRPHIKTHKMPGLARRQLALGAVGIAVAKLSEAEVMARHGIADIQIANQIIGPHKIGRLRDLARSVRLSCAVDHPRQVRDISTAFEQEARPVDLLIEIDTGLHRCGLTNLHEVTQLARVIQQSPGVRFAGLMTHAGHAYAATDRDQLRLIARQEGEQLVSLATGLRAVGIEVDTVSVGSTPTAGEVIKVPGITELRVGNYIFNDMIQVGLGVAEVSDCALTVLASVISTPSADRVVIDAGSKALSLDRGAHGRTTVTGYGRILGKQAILDRLSEEHGVITHRGEPFTIGERVRIIPNHACATVNLYDRAYLVSNVDVIEELRIEARGMLT